MAWPRAIDALTAKFAAEYATKRELAEKCEQLQDKVNDLVATVAKLVARIEKMDRGQSNAAPLETRFSEQAQKIGELTALQTQSSDTIRTLQDEIGSLKRAIGSDASPPTNFDDFLTAVSDHSQKIECLSSFQSSAASRIEKAETTAANQKSQIDILTVMTTVLLGLQFRAEASISSLDARCADFVQRRWGPSGNVTINVDGYRLFLDCRDGQRHSSIELSAKPVVWTLVPRTAASFWLICPRTRLALAIADRKKYLLKLDDPSSGEEQEWLFAAHQIVNPKTRLVLDVCGEQMRPGTAILAFKNHDGWNQKWVHTPACV